MFAEICEDILWIFVEICVDIPGILAERLGKEHDTEKPKTVSRYTYSTNRTPLCLELSG